MCLHIIHNTITFTILIMYKYKQWFRSTIMYWNCHIKWTHLVSGYKSPYHLSSNYNKTKSYSPSVSATTCKNSPWLWFWQWNRWQPPNLQHVSVWIDTTLTETKGWSPVIFRHQNTLITKSPFYLQRNPFLESISLKCVSVECSSLPHYMSQKWQRHRGIWLRRQQEL